MDPLSLSVLSAAAALTKGIEFLYAQAGEILKRRRERADPKAPSSEVPEPPPDVPEVIAGELQPLVVDDVEADRLEGDIRELRRALSEYADGTYPVDLGNENLLAATDALRCALEAVYGQRLTFVGEDRSASESGLQAAVDVGWSRGMSPAFASA